MDISNVIPSLGMKSLDLSNLRLLIAEENWFMRSTLRSVFRTFNIRSVVDNGALEEAWTAFVSTRPDVCFIDWSPSYNGLDLLRKIRTDKESSNPYAPVIITSSLTDPEHVFEARDAGATEFIAKPYSPLLIYKRLYAVIEHPRKFVRAPDFFGPDRRRRKVAVDEERRKNTPSEAAPSPPNEEDEDTMSAPPDDGTQ